MSNVSISSKRPRNKKKEKSAFEKTVNIKKIKANKDKQTADIMLKLGKGSVRVKASKRKGDSPEVKRVSGKYKIDDRSSISASHTPRGGLYGGPVSRVNYKWKF